MSVRIAESGTLRATLGRELDGRIGCWRAAAGIAGAGGDGRTADVDSWNADLSGSTCELRVPCLPLTVRDKLIEKICDEICDSGFGGEFA